jgi:DNA-directed RNA polymerase specialized sigma24 family protein
MPLGDLGPVLAAERPKAVACARQFLHTPSAREDAEDVYAKSVESTWEWIQSRTDEVSPELARQYLYGCIWNIAKTRNRDHIRRERLVASNGTDIRRNNHKTPTVGPDEKADANKILRFAERHLNAHEFIAFWNWVRGASYREIAEFLGTSEAAARQMVSRSRRNLRLLFAATTILLVAGAVALWWNGWPSSMQFERDGSHWIFKNGIRERVVVTPTSKYGDLIAPWGERFEDARWDDFDGDGEKEWIIVSLDAERPDDTLGAIRIDCMSPKGETKWSLTDDAPVSYANGERVYSGHEFALEHLEFRDANGDGLTDVLFVSTHLYFPSRFVILDGSGQKIVDYTNPGHIKSIVALPADFLALGEQRRESGEAYALSVYLQESASCGLVYLPPRAGSGALPAETIRYRNDAHDGLDGLVAVKLPPSTVAQYLPAGHNWPANIDFERSSGRIRIATIEIPNDFVLIHYLDDQLRKTQVTPSDRFLIEHHRLSKEDPELPALDSDAFATSVETIERWQNGAWKPYRSHGLWSPEPDPDI